jgi:hypothetical protein
MLDVLLEWLIALWRSLGKLFRWLAQRRRQ